VLEVAVAHRLLRSSVSPRYKQRLRERRLVALVVAVTAVAVHVDHDVAQERVAKVHRQPHDLRDGLRILAVDVEIRDLQQLRDVGRVGRGARLRGRVVKPIWLLMMTWIVPPMVCASTWLMFSVSWITPFAANAASPWMVNGDLLRARDIAGAVLLGARAADHDRVHVLEVARVEAQREVHLLAALVTKSEL
jgi:hypothetical protein